MENQALKRVLRGYFWQAYFDLALRWTKRKPPPVSTSMMCPRQTIRWGENKATKICSGSRNCKAITQPEFRHGVARRKKARLNQAKVM